MSSPRFNRQLHEALPSWEQRGWVTPDGAAQLRAAHPVDSSPSRAGSIILASVGTALLLGGLILILAHNWEELSRPLRAVISVLPLLLSIGLGTWVLRRRPHSLAWAESTALAASLSLCAAISLVAQTYQISGDFPRFILTWAVFTLGAALILGSGVALILYQVLACIWAWKFRDTTWVAPGYAALLAASAPFFLRRLWGSDREATCRRIILPLFLCATAGLSAPLRSLHGAGWNLAAWSTWFALVFLVADAPSRPLGKGVRWLSAIGLAVMLVIYSFDDTWRHLRFEGSIGWMSESGQRRFWDALPFAMGWLIALHGALVAMIIRRRGELDLVNWLWAAAGFIGCASWLLQPDSSWSTLPMLAVNALALVLALITMLDGLRNANALRANLGWLLLSALVLCRFFDSDLSFLARGLAFIVLGAGFLALNWFLTRRRNQNKPTDPTA